MKRLTLFFPVLMLVACATPQDLVGRPDAVSFSLAMSAQAAEQQVAGAWLEHSSAVSVVPISGGFMLYLTHPTAGTDVAVQILEAHGGCTVRYGMRARAFSPEWMESPLLKLRASAVK